MRITLALMALALYGGNYFLCNAIFPGDDVESLTNWYTLKHACLSVSIAILVCLSFIRPPLDHRVSDFVLALIFACAINDMFDRLFFDVRHFHLNDLLLIPLTIIAYKWNTWKAVWGRWKKKLER